MAALLGTLPPAGWVHIDRGEIVNGETQSKDTAGWAPFEHFQSLKKAALHALN